MSWTERERQMYRRQLAQGPHPAMIRDKWENWTERERAAFRYEMAHRTITTMPIAELPNGRLVYDADLDVTPGERTGIVVAYAIVTLAIVGAILAPLALGGLLIMAFGW